MIGVECTQFTDITLFIIAYGNGMKTSSRVQNREEEKKEANASHNAYI